MVAGWQMKSKTVVSSRATRQHWFSSTPHEPLTFEKPPRLARFELEESDIDARPPKLLRTSLALGAKVCGPPAFDREFKIIDFLTLIDLNSLAPAIRNRLLEIVTRG